MDCLILQETPTRSSNEIILICANNAGMIDNSRTRSFSFATTLGILYNLSCAKTNSLNTFQQKAAYKMSDVHWISRVRLKASLYTSLPYGVCYPLTYVRTHLCVPSNAVQCICELPVSHPKPSGNLTTLPLQPHLSEKKNPEKFVGPSPPSLVCTCIHISSPVSSRMALPASQSVISWDGLHTKPGCCNCCSGWPQS